VLTCLINFPLHNPLSLRNDTGLTDCLKAVKDLLQGDGPIGQAVQKSAEAFFQDFVREGIVKDIVKTTAPLVVQVGEALPYVKEIIPILKTLVDMYKEQGKMVEEYEALKRYLGKIQVLNY
jgi:hypothetical protein